MKITVFAPHPDDEVIGCGGSIAKHTSQGNEISVVYLTSGDASSDHLNKQQLALLRESEAKKSSQILGIKKNIFLKKADGYLNFNQENLIEVVTQIRKLQPDTIYIPHENDDHRDHLITHKLVMEAVKKASGSWYDDAKENPWQVKNILAYEIWTPMSRFQLVTNIEKFLDQKMDALNQHKSQLEAVDYVTAARSLSNYRGLMTQVGKFAEVFQVLKLEKI